jgi:hypothetical protein
MDNKHLIMQTRAKNLEDMFFLEQDRILMEQFHRMEKMKETKESLAKVTGIASDDVLQNLVEMNIRPDVAASLALVPLVEVAWADGEIDENEKAAILKADGTLFDKDSPDLPVLKQWLEHKPNPQLLEAWRLYIQGLCVQMTIPQKAALRTEVIGHARQVALAAGGFLGLGNKISKAEQEMLDQLEAAFD